jgi:hypothetical protein
VSAPRLSVVVCALGRPGAGAAVASVRHAAQIGGIDAQAVLVWQSEEEPPPLPPGSSLVRAFPGGLAYARNRGIDAAEADIVAFIDDDELASPTWATAVMAAFGEGADAATGPIRPADDQGFAHCNFDGPDLRWYSGVSTPPWTVGSGGNLAIRRDLLVRLGGFDLRMGPGSFGRSADDTDLFARLLARGARIRWRPDMSVTHPTKTAAERLATRGPYGFGAGRVVRRQRSPALAVRYGVGLAWGLRSAARERSGRRLRELATSASGFAAGTLSRDTWRSPQRLVDLVPAAIRAELAGRRLEAWRVPHRAPPHFLWAAGPGLVLHAYVGSETRMAAALQAREAALAAGIGGIPRVRATVQEADVCWVLEERMTGRRPPALRRESWAVAAGWAKDLARTAGPPLRLTAWWDLARRTVPASPAFDAALEHISDRPAVVVHRDLQAKNVLIDRGARIAVLDWEHAGAYGPPGLDLLFLAVSARAPTQFGSAARALMRGHEPEGTPVLALLRDAGLDAAGVEAALIVSAHIWAADEDARGRRLGVPSQQPQYELLLRGLLPRPQRDATSSSYTPS